MTARPMLPTALGLGLVAGWGNDTSALPAATATGTATTQSAVTPASPSKGANAYIGSIAVDPMILGTGLGLFRLDAGAKSAERVLGTLSTSEASGEISSNLVVRFRGPGDLLASGHPKGAGALPENLGLIRWRDAGETWTERGTVGRTVHDLAVDRNRVLYVSAPDGEVWRSTDRGATWKRHLVLE